ncbi:MAG: hypothetical protein WEB13_07375 [Dehalococcoidia bacterium]
MWAASGNELILTAPLPERVRLGRILKRRRLDPGEILHREGETIDRVWFPLSSAVALTVPSAGGIVAAGLVGREGIVGLAGLYLRTAASLRVEVLWPGDGLVGPARTLAAHLDDWPGLRRGLYRYHARLLASVAVEGACQRTHALEARLARRLLELLDRGLPPGEGLRLDVLARSLGEPDAHVEAAASVLAAGAAVELHGGRMLPGRRSALLAAACNCSLTNRAWRTSG